MLKNVGWLSLGQLVQSVGGAVLLVYLTRRLGPASFGAWQFCVAIGSYLVFAGTLGIDAYGTWLVARDTRQARALAVALMRLQVLLCLLVIAGLALVVVIVPFQYAPRGLLLLAVGAALVRALWPDWLLRGLQRGRMLGINDIILTVATVGLLLLVVKGPADTIRIPLSQLLLAAVLAPAVWWIAVYRGRLMEKDPSPTIGSAIGVVRASIPLALATLMVQIYYNTGYVLTRLLRTNVDTALFAASYRPVLALMAFGAAVRVAAYPHLTESVARGRPLQDFLRRLNSLLLLVTLPIAVGGTITASQLVLFLFGSQYAGAVNAFRLLLWALPVNVVGSTYADVMLAYGERPALAKIVTAGAGLSLVANLILIPVAGVFGAAASALLTEITVISMCVWKAGVGLRISPSYVVVTGVATILMTVTMLALASPPVVLRIASGGAVYVLVAGLSMALLHGLGHRSLVTKI